MSWKNYHISKKHVRTGRDYHISMQNMLRTERDDHISMQNMLRERLSHKQAKHAKNWKRC